MLYLPRHFTSRRLSVMLAGLLALFANIGHGSPDDDAMAHRAAARQPGAATTDSGVGRAREEAVRRAHEEAVRDARAGRVTDAYRRLEALFAEHPETLSLRLDLAVVAGWAGDDARTLELLTPLEPESLPDYALEGLARAARNRQLWDRSVAAYERLLERQPQRMDFRIARALVLADRGDVSAARQALSELPTKDTDPAVATARGYVEERARQLVRALHFYQRALEMDSRHAEARRRLILTLSKLGAARQALAEAETDPTLLGDAEMQRLKLDAAAQQLRFSGLPNPEAPREHARRALALHREVADASASADGRRHPSRTLELDRIPALVADFRMLEAVSAFEALEREPGAEALPAYVLAAACEAYLYLERPEAAVAACRHALRKVPRNMDVKVTLFYAYSDLGDHAAARNLADELLAEQPAWRQPAPGTWLPNPDHVRAREVDAQELAFRQRYGEALVRFDDMLALAPANVWLRLSRAQVKRWRGWYRAAAEDVQRARLQSPDSPRVQAVTGHVALDNREWAQAQRATAHAVRLAPYARSTLALVERWRLHNRPALTLTAGADESRGSAFASRGWRTEGFYHTAPIARRYRAFLHDRVRRGRFDEGTGRDHRLGVGMEYRVPDWRATFELHRGLEQNREAGAAASVVWQPDDHWTLEGRADANSGAVPLRATRIGVTADSAEVAVDYRWHEGRSASAAAGVMDFDDGNLRRWLRMDYQTRVINLADHRLLARARVYASRNDDAGRVYFNPPTDRELSVGLTHEWRVFQRYDRALTQRFGVEAGGYRQAGFGSDSVWTVILSHEWSLGPRGSLRYGVEGGGRVYDGEREHTASIFLSLGWRL